ncbi:MAG TPA: hypothetical protein DCL21_07175 [Alphaproteobacteria bacterium]|nr:hypothetical protein [Alphaproteobacteria bacterium]
MSTQEARELPSENSILAAKLADMALTYGKAINLKFIHKDEYGLLCEITHFAKQKDIDQNKVKKAIAALKKVLYQSRTKKGHKYQFDYIVSCILISVFDVLINEDEAYSFYNPKYFKNYLTSPIHENTIPRKSLIGEHFNNQVSNIEKVCAGTVFIWDDIDL